MAIYVFTFAISTLFFKLADYVKKEQRICVDSIAIILLCLLAGFRAQSIGTDTAGYIQPMIKGAISSENIKDFFQYSWISGFSTKTVLNYEIGYTLFVYFISSLFKSIVVTQSALELLAILPIYFAIREKKDIPIWLGMLVFMLQFYNGSFNLIRQTIAMAFMLLGVTYWINDKRKKFVISFVCAVLFHTSGLIGIIIIVLYEYIGRYRNMKIKSLDRKISINYLNLAIAIGIGIAALIGIKIVIALLTQFGLAKYVGYIFGDIRFMPNQIINVLPPAILLIFSFKYFKDHQEEWAFYVVMMAYTMVTGQFTSVNSFGGRIRLYFMIFSIFSYPLVCTYSCNKRTSKIIIISYLACYWWFYYVFSGSDQTVPYILIH